MSKIQQWSAPALAAWSRLRGKLGARWAARRPRSLPLRLAPHTPRPRATPPARPPRLAGPLGVQARRWAGWALVALMSVVLLIQISVLTTRAYRVYDLEAARTRLARERRDLVLQLGAAQPLGGLAEAAGAAGLAPAAPEQWTIVSIPSPEARP